jgi:hypothetical protein
LYIAFRRVVSGHFGHLSPASQASGLARGFASGLARVRPLAFQHPLGLFVAHFFQMSDESFFDL